MSQTIEGSIGRYRIPAAKGHRERGSNPKIAIHMTVEMLAEIDALAKRNGVSFAEQARRLLAVGLFEQSADDAA
jgi:hypothetical protein